MRKEGEEDEEEGWTLLFVRPPEKTLRGSGGMRAERDHQPCSLNMLVPETKLSNNKNIHTVVVTINFT